MPPRKVTFVDAATGSLEDVSARAIVAIELADALVADPDVAHAWRDPRLISADEIDRCDGEIVWLVGGDALERHAHAMRSLRRRGAEIAWAPSASGDRLATSRALDAWLDAHPLAGRRVFVTRAPHQAEETATALRARGATPVLVPTVTIEPPIDRAPLDAAIDRLADFDVVALTSANGVRALGDALSRRGLDARALAGSIVATIGPGTSRALFELGIKADLVADEHRGEALAEAILSRLRGRAPRRGARARVLLPRAAVARNALPELLAAASIDVEVIDAYRSQPPSIEAIAPLLEALDALRGSSAERARDAILFTASSTVDNAIDALASAGIVDPALNLRSIVVASIGPITSETARRRGVRVDVEAKPYTIAALLDALERHFALA